MAAVIKTLTGHARKQMAARHIPEEAIDWVLANFDSRRPAKPIVRTKPAEILSGVYNGRRLKVYVEIGSDPPKVKTVVWSGDD